MATLRSKGACQRLGIPATTLRLWSNTFEDFLSPSARASISEKGTPTQRHYTEADIDLLTQIQSMLSVGLTYDAIREVLQNNPTTEVSLPALASVVSSNGHQNGTLALPDPESLSELTTLLARSVTLQEETAVRHERMLAIQEETLELLREQQQHQHAVARSTHPPTLWERLVAVVKPGGQ